MLHQRLASKGGCDGSMHVEETCMSRSVAQKMLLSALDTLHLLQVKRMDVMAIARGDEQAVAHLRIIRARH